MTVVRYATFPDQIMPDVLLADLNKKMYGCAIKELGRSVLELLRAQHGDVLAPHTNLTAPPEDKPDLGEPRFGHGAMVQVHRRLHLGVSARDRSADAGRSGQAPIESPGSWRNGQGFGGPSRSFTWRRNCPWLKPNDR